MAASQFGAVEVQRNDDRWCIQVPVYLGAIDPVFVRVELYADRWQGHDAVCQPMLRGEPLPGAITGTLYGGSVPATWPAEHFTPRIIPMHPAACVPLEASRDPLASLTSAPGMWGAAAGLG